MRYLVRRYVTVPELEEHLGFLLSELGTLGTEVRPGAAGRVEVVAYFAGAPGPPAALPQAVGERVGGVELVDESVLDEKDWLAVYRQRARPVTVGQRFLVDPREPDAPAPAAAGRWLLRLPARTAFGTGSHPSTRLVVEWLEELRVAGLRVLDVGCGSGILALAARRLGARWVAGFDLDLPSALMAGQYGRANRIGVAFFAGSVEGLGARPAFDLALVNVLPPRIGAQIEQVVTRVRPGGGLVVSGALASEEAAVLAAWAARGARPRGHRDADGWRAWHLERSA